MKKAFIISSTKRIGGNSDILAKKFRDGALDAGNKVSFISIKDLKMEFCKGCLACQKLHRCIINDDINDLLEKIKESDVIVFATPIYYYSVSGQLKTFLDRMNPLYNTDYSFRDIYFIASAFDSNDEAFNVAIKDIEGFASCFEKSSLKGTVLGKGLGDAKDAEKHKDLLDKAYDMGKNI